MAELKTKQTESSVEAFLGTISDETRQRDCRTISKMMKRATKAKPKGLVEKPLSIKTTV